MTWVTEWVNSEQGLVGLLLRTQIKCHHPSRSHQQISTSISRKQPLTGNTKRNHNDIRFVLIKCFVVCVENAQRPTICLQLALWAISNWMRNHTNWHSHQRFYVQRMLGGETTMDIVCVLWWSPFYPDVRALWMGRTTNMNMHHHWHWEERLRYIGCETEHAWNDILSLYVRAHHKMKQRNFNCKSNSCISLFCKILIKYCRICSYHNKMQRSCQK